MSHASCVSDCYQTQTKSRPSPGGPVLVYSKSQASGLDIGPPRAKNGFATGETRFEGRLPTHSIRGIGNRPLQCPNEHGGFQQRTNFCRLIFLSNITFRLYRVMYDN